MATSRTPKADQFGQGVTYQGDTLSLSDIRDAGYTMVGNQAYDSDGNPVSLVPEMNQRMTPKGMFRKLVIPVLLLAVGGFLMSKKKTRMAGYIVGGLGAVIGVMAFIKK